MTVDARGVPTSFPRQIAGIVDAVQEVEEGTKQLVVKMEGAYSKQNHASATRIAMEVLRSDSIADSDLEKCLAVLSVSAFYAKEFKTYHRAIEAYTLNTNYSSKRRAVFAGNLAYHAPSLEPFLPINTRRVADDIDVESLISQLHVPRPRDYRASSTSLDDRMVGHRVRAFIRLTNYYAIMDRHNKIQYSSPSPTYNSFLAVAWYNLKTMALEDVRIIEWDVEKDFPFQDMVFRGFEDVRPVPRTPGAPASDETWDVVGTAKFTRGEDIGIGRAVLWIDSKTGAPHLDSKGLVQLPTHGRVQKNWIPFRDPTRGYSRWNMVYDFDRGIVVDSNGAFCHGIASGVDFSQQPVSGLRGSAMVHLHDATFLCLAHHSVNNPAQRSSLYLHRFLLVNVVGRGVEVERFTPMFQFNSASSPVEFSTGMFLDNSKTSDSDGPVLHVLYSHLDSDTHAITFRLRSVMDQMMKPSMFRGSNLDRSREIAAWVTQK